MATNKNSNRYSSGLKKNFFKGKTFMLLLGVIFGAGVMILAYNTSVYFSSDRILYDVSCASACGRQLETIQARK